MLRRCAQSTLCKAFQVDLSSISKFPTASRTFHATNLNLARYSQTLLNEVGKSELTALEHDLPKVAIVGRPNVGKSALFNRLVGRKEALMHNTPDDHVTRDIREGGAHLQGLDFQVLDTPGLEPTAAAGSIQQRAMTLTHSIMQDSSTSAAVFVVDGKEGLHPDDRAIALWLLRSFASLPVVLVANKCEKITNRDLHIYDHGALSEDSEDLAEFSGPNPEEMTLLGFGMPVVVSAETGMGMRDLHRELDRVLYPDLYSDHMIPRESDDDDDDDEHKEMQSSQPSAAGRSQFQDSSDRFKSDEYHNDDDLNSEDEDEDHRPAMQLAILGRPNVGKSTLVNQLLGKDRVLVGPERGLTRDSIRLPVSYQGEPVWLVDTAGWEKRNTLYNQGTLSNLGNLETKRSLNRAHVVVLVLDAKEWIQQGKMIRSEVALARKVAEEGKALVIVLNKADSLPLKSASESQDECWERHRDTLQKEVETWLPQVGKIPVYTMSASTGSGVSALLPQCVDLYDRWCDRISTGRLNRWLLKIATRNVGGGPSRVRYLTQIKARPPTFCVFTRGRGDLTDANTRQLLNSIRSDFGFDGVPLRIVTRRKSWESHVLSRNQPKGNAEESKPAPKKRKRDQAPSFTNGSRVSTQSSGDGKKSDKNMKQGDEKSTKAKSSEVKYDPKTGMRTTARLLTADLAKLKNKKLKQRKRNQRPSKANFEPLELFS